MNFIAYHGVTENTYMFIQGHHIMESVTIKLLTPICSALRREREEEIKRLAVHHLQYRNELAGYELWNKPLFPLLCGQCGGAGGSGS